MCLYEGALESDAVPCSARLRARCSDSRSATARRHVYVYHAQGTEEESSVASGSSCGNNIQDASRGLGAERIGARARAKAQFTAIPAAPTPAGPAATLIRVCHPWFQSEHDLEFFHSLFSTEGLEALRRLLTLDSTTALRMYSLDRGHGAPRWMDGSARGGGRDGFAIRSPSHNLRGPRSDDRSCVRLAPLCECKQRLRGERLHLRRLRAWSGEESEWALN